jgi:hypothetical protein
MEITDEQMKITDEQMEIPNNSSLELNNTLPYFPKEMWLQIFQHFSVREKKESLYFVCKQFHVIIETQLSSEYIVLYVSPPERHEHNQRNKELVSRFFTVYHEPLLKGIKVHDEIMFLTQDEFIHFCKNPQLLTPMRIILKLDGFDINVIHGLLKTAHNSLNITILSLGEGSQGINSRFPEICKETLPNLEGLNLSSFTIYSTLWDFSKLSFIKFNMSRMMCQPELRIRMPCSLRGLYINYQQGMFKVKQPNSSNVGILLNDCHELDEW